MEEMQAQQKIVLPDGTASLYLILLYNEMIAEFLRRIAELEDRVTALEP